MIKFRIEYNYNVIIHFVNNVYKILFNNHLINVLYVIIKLNIEWISLLFNIDIIFKNYINYIKWFFFVYYNNIIK